MFTKYYNGLRRRVARTLDLHPTSYPYISGDVFRGLATHIYDMDSTITANTVQRADIVFVQSFRIHDFFEKIHPNINAPYFLITHNGDENIATKHLDYLDDKIIHWFAQNCLVDHPKLTPLPIGLENKWYYLHGIPKYFDKLKLEIVTKKNAILYKFSVATNPTERGIALSTLQTTPLSETYSDWRESWAYLRTVQQYTFVASPVGNGADCHRTWEAMYLGTIPIVTDSPMTRSFAALGLPLMVINDWSEITPITKEELTQRYAKIRAQSATTALAAQFWIDLIRHKQTSYADVS